MKNDLVVFIIPPKKDINGGILSIFSLCKESRRFKPAVLLSVTPGDKSYIKNDLFKNDEKIFSFDEVIKKFPQPDSLILHIPEYMVADTPKMLRKYMDYIQGIPNFHINILNQNIQLMPEPIDVWNLMKIAGKVTQTTAHLSYTNQGVCDRYSIPTHLFSVSIDPSQYELCSFNTKQNIIAFSPDSNPLKREIISKIQNELTEFKVIEVKNMTYETYKDLAKTCKFMLTFGEGFDSYLIEPTFSGGITFAVYNEDFFPSTNYKELPNIYLNYDEMLSKLIDDITRLDSSGAYNALNKKNFDMISSVYSYEKYTDNIREFYAGNFTLSPTTNAAATTLLGILADKTLDIDRRDLLLGERARQIEAQNKMIESQRLDILAKENYLRELTASLSWKITRPLRDAHKIISRH